VKDVGAETKVPIGVAVEGIEFAKSGILPFIGPSEPAILQVYLIEFTSLEHVPEAHHATSINMTFVFVPSSPDLVKVSKRKPSHPLRRLMRGELGVELVLEGGVRRPINGGNLEIPIFASKSMQV
jgi:hypothetical protein